MYPNQTYFPFMHQMFLNPYHPYEPFYPCPCHHWNQNMYGRNLYAMNEMESINPYLNYSNDVNPMQIYPVNEENQLNSLSVRPNQNNRSEDFGKEPYVLNIEEAAERNQTFRTAIWTGENLQVTLMSIGVGDDIGLEVHPDTDQFLRIEEGEGLVQMGDTRNEITFRRNVSEDDAIMVPAGMWHNLTNRGDKPLKLYTIYAPPEHPFGTVHRTKADTEE